MLMIDFINVGYGDSVLIREMQDDGQIFSMLIDCGDVTTGTSEGESKRIKAADFLHKEGVNKLDLLVITHLHLDHVGGFVHMLSDIQISELWCNYLPEKKYWGREVQQSEYLSCGARSLLTSLNIYSKALYQLANKGTKILCIQSNRKTLSLGEALQMEVFCEKTELYHQQEKIWNRAFEGCVSSDELDRLDLFINNTSLRMRLGYAGKEIELPGDICASSWERHHISKCAILKLPHHGHKDSFTEKLAAMLQADYTVISVSNSREDDCPSLKTIGLAQKYSNHILFTDAVTFSNKKPEHHESVRFYIFEDGRITMANNNFCRRLNNETL